MIRVILSAERGFCSGVAKAVKLALNEAEKTENDVFVLHELVHNDAVVRDLSEHHVRIVKDPEGLPPGSNLIFSAHGVSEAVERRTDALRLNVKDATCPLVKRVHHLAASLYHEGRMILLAGKKGHSEVEGILGRIPENAGILLESEKDAEAFFPDPGKKYALLSQTTFLVQGFEKIESILKDKIHDLKVVRTICPATKTRQDAVAAMAKECSGIVVVGSPGSSNSRRLCETARTAGVKTFLIQKDSPLPEELRTFSGTLGLISGASASEEEVQTVLKSLLALTDAEFMGERQFTEDVKS